MATFHGTFEEKGVISLVMDNDFYTYEWKDGDLLKVQINNNGTICFYHVEPIVRHIEA
tara:strand:+ start:1782 stop:1955 length:174 start_codon:yes stop_codon:yes gene_type:complete